jgi:uncharacterized protein (TIGR03118 family)
MSGRFLSRWNCIERLEGRQLLSAANAVPVIAQTDLVSNGAVPAAHTDANLVNAWGMAISNVGNVWVANNGTGTSTVYDQAGNSQNLVVTIPGTGTAAAFPTGTVFHKGKGFNVSSGGVSGASTFIFDSEDGIISGWNQSVDLTHAIVAVDHSAAGDVFKGLATIGNRLYATDFHHGTIEVFDENFQQLANKPGTFADASIPTGFAPFGIQAIGSKLYVTYAKQDAPATGDVAGVGNGFVDVFSAGGHLMRRLASGGALNSPWGIAQVPNKWGKFKGDIVVGNFRDGLMNVFNNKGQAVGQLSDSTGTPLVIQGLWSLEPGVGGNKEQLFFTAGPNDETNGLFGDLSASVTGVVPGTTGGGYTAGTPNPTPKPKPVITPTNPGGTTTGGTTGGTPGGTPTGNPMGGYPGY